MVTADDLRRQGRLTVVRGPVRVPGEADPERRIQPDADDASVMLVADGDRSLAMQSVGRSGVEDCRLAPLERLADAVEGIAEDLAVRPAREVGPDDIRTGQESIFPLTNVQRHRRLPGGRGADQHKERGHADLQVEVKFYLMTKG